MSERDIDAEGQKHKRHKATADKKIALQEERMNRDGSSGKQRAADQLLMNEMRGNQASVDLNRALHDYETEKGKRHP